MQLPTVTDRNASESYTHRWTAFASDLQIAPGIPPNKLMAEIGNGECFILTSYDSEKANYTQQLGCLSLTVFND